MRAADDTPADLLDAWLPHAAVRTHHRHTGAGDLWSAANSLPLSATRTLGRLVRWRIPGLARDLTYGELFRAYPFIVLDEGEQHLIAGLCGRIWTLARDYPRLEGPEAFAAWDEPGTVRVLFGHWIHENELVSEARVQPTDRSSALRLKALWKVIGPFERHVGGEALSASAARARSQRG